MRSLRAALLPLLCLTSLLGACGNSTAPDPDWVEIYDPAAAAPGYNLTLFRRRIPTLIDLNGNAVHRWPVKAAGRARLLPNGGLLLIGTDETVRELDWNGRTIWQFRPPGEDFPHHDVIPLRNGNRLVLAHDVAEDLDYLLEVDAAGSVAWEWRSRDHLAADLERERQALARRERTETELTHINSLQELPPNRWFDGGDLRFRPGNILISARNLDTLYLLDRETGEVVWRYEEGLDRQHEAAMIPRGFPGEGNIAFFNNGLRDRFVYRRSSVVEIDPVAGSVVWSYRAPNFFSSTAGTQQSLANGNVMMTSSRGGRVFEITRDGRVVWQWTPSSFMPMRDHRYPYDYCPQLARLPRPRPRPVSTTRRHVDRELYDFQLHVPSRPLRIEGRERRLLSPATVCRELVLPERAQLTVGFGFEERAGTAAILATEETAVVKAAVRLTPVLPGQDMPPTRTLLERELQPVGARAWTSFEETTVDLSEYELGSVELCLAAAAPGGQPPGNGFFWTAPRVRSAALREEDENERVDAAQRAAQEKHLKALGYID